MFFWKEHFTLDKGAENTCLESIKLLLDSGHNTQDPAGYLSTTQVVCASHMFMSCLKGLQCTLRLLLLSSHGPAEFQC